MAAGVAPAEGAKAPAGNKSPKGKGAPSRRTAAVLAGLSVVIEVIALFITVQETDAIVETGTAFEAFLSTLHAVPPSPPRPSTPCAWRMHDRGLGLTLCATATAAHGAERAVRVAEDRPQSDAR